MNINQIKTPAFLLDIDTLNHNISAFQTICDENGVGLWPMTKTHKSTEIATRQIDAGAEGFLAGTLAEVEALAKIGAKSICYAYPLANRANIQKIIALSKSTRLILSIDGIEGAGMVEEELSAQDATMEYLLIINSGLNRFGIAPDETARFIGEMKALPHLKFLGIATHPGQVYACSDKEGVSKCVEEERAAIAVSLAQISSIGEKALIVASGSSPTMKESCLNKDITVQRPGNYVFFDRIQQSLGACEYSDCALTIFSTVISNPSEDVYIIDAGSKCFGLDLGAHGVSNIIGYGHSVKHPEITVLGLSEEVGKIKVSGGTKLSIGEKIRFIPNHSCSSANLADRFTLCKGDEVVGYFDNDMKP